MKNYLDNRLSGLIDPYDSFSRIRSWSKSKLLFFRAKYWDAIFSKRVAKRLGFKDKGPLCRLHADERVFSTHSGYASNMRMYSDVGIQGCTSIIRLGNESGDSIVWCYNCEKILCRDFVLEEKKDGGGDDFNPRNTPSPSNPSRSEDQPKEDPEWASLIE